MILYHIIFFFFFFFFFFNIKIFLYGMITNMSCGGGIAGGGGWVVL